MAVLQPSDPNKKYIYTLKPDADVNDIYYITSLNGVKQSNFEFDVDGTSRAEFDLSSYQIVEGSIDSGSNTSSVIDCGFWKDDKSQLVGLYFPNTFSSNSGTFTSSDESSGTFNTIKSVGGASNYSITISTGCYVPVDPEVFSGASFIKLVTSSNQTADRTVKFVIRPVE
jgi:hypothetical protein